ncbi:basic amino acid ABC transporter substrate-binding protein [Bacillus mesophilus]|uniref:Basic amino acid ABC transporter substrate-binding protein n=2 Tax=Bacillus mesophilus TaxID=1808955 RepID=A0A6M0QAK1_9BACI|nr:basic amino acid ABC transporter substrate-binding protein [Bacillus mesophilus]
MMFMLVLAACGTGETGTGGEAEEGTEEAKKSLIVGTDAAFAPFEYMDKGEIVGFDVDFLTAVMEEAGYEFELNNIGWDPLFASVQGEEIDLAISGITINDDRKQTYDFSTPYFQSTHMIVFNEGAGITSAKDLEGKRIGVQNGTTGQSAAEKIVGANNANISKYETTAVAFMALANGDVEVVVTDNVVANEYVKNNPDAKVEAIEDPENFDSEYYGLMFPKGSELKAEFDAAIKTVIENGTYTEIYKKWFGTEPNVDELLAAE